MAGDLEVIEIGTPRGTARAHVHAVDAAKGAIVLGHGAGGGVEAPDLVAAKEAAHDEGFAVALIEQPYRVGGRRAPAPAGHLDEAWLSVLEHLGANQLAGIPLITGGRSLGARVACRTAEASGSIAVLCLAFPLRPPARKGKPPRPDRLDELDGVAVPTLVVQGRSDQFGLPGEGPRRRVARVPGNHSLRTDTAAVADAVRAWLPGVVSM